MPGLVVQELLNRFQDAEIDLSSEYSMFTSGWRSITQLLRSNLGVILHRILSFIRASIPFVKLNINPFRSSIASGGLRVRTHLPGCETAGVLVLSASALLA